MRAITVCVDYHDILAITLPYNRLHFERICIVTDRNCWNKGVMDQFRTIGCDIVVTDSFYDNGATFNKWKALEYGLDMFGRHGLICLMDADVIWPKIVPPDSYYERGFLYSPLRRMLNDPSPFLTMNTDYNFHTKTGSTKLSFPESRWKYLPIHRNVNEWAGYSQIFHADDPALGSPPWHETDWKHAGGADSFFQQKWPTNKKIRPPFEVLHIGEAGKNWYGRVTSYMDGTKPLLSELRESMLLKMFANRRGRAGEDRYESERIKEKPS